MIQSLPRGRCPVTVYSVDKAGKHCINEIRQTQKDKYCMISLIEIKGLVTEDWNGRNTEM